MPCPFDDIFVALMMVLTNGGWDFLKTWVGR